MPDQHAMNPRVLLVEDDAISCRVLAAAVAALPARVDTAHSCAEALELAARFRHDAWLLDAHLPDGTGIGLLASLRERHPATPALAHTAAHDRATLDRLVAAGFAEVLVKPFPAATLQGMLRRALGDAAADTPARRPGSTRLPTWDDDVALRALGGGREHVEALRALFLRDVAAQRDAVLTALRDGAWAAAQAQLHRLRASCGFVGAVCLGQAVRALQSDPDCEATRRMFDDAVADVLDSVPVPARDASELGQHVP